MKKVLAVVLALGLVVGVTVVTGVVSTDKTADSQAKLAYDPPVGG